MKKLLPYIYYIALFCCISMTSCINEYFEDTTANAMVELRLTMPAAENVHDRAMSKASSHTETGSNYENTIIGEKDLRLFIFKSADNTFIDEVKDLKLIRANNYDQTQLLQGKLPNSTLGQKIRLVMMVNYKSRGADPIKPTASQKYGKWQINQKFNYGSQAWSEANGYIPMSGECTINVDPNAKLTNYGIIDLKRAIAKVRIKIKDGCTYKISSIQTNNAGATSYSLTQKNFNVPDQTAHALYEPLQFTKNFFGGKNDYITAGKAFEYYIPEQPVDQTWLNIQFVDAKGKNVGNPERIDFKVYPNGQTFEIERNFIYEFVVNKKADDTMSDITIGVEPWVVEKEIISDYE